jgi:glycine oxidase
VALFELATASARLYPEFVSELEQQSGIRVDLRDAGTILLLSPENLKAHPAFAKRHPLPGELQQLEPSLASNGLATAYLAERSVDPRALVAAACEAAKRAGVTFVKADVTDVVIANGRACGVATALGSFDAGTVVNCTGAWAGQFGPHRFPTRPVKGEMLCLAAPRENLLRHVIRSPQVYLIPRSDGRILAGATVEEAGFDKQTVASTIDKLHDAAAAVVPELRHARPLEAWAGLRPGTPDSLPILGATATPGYFVATGHFRDGILLAPITARVMADIITGVQPDYDLALFSPARLAMRS